MMKLRFSCGIGGNIAKNSAPYMTAYYNNNTHVGGIQGTISNRLILICGGKRQLQLILV